MKNRLLRKISPLSISIIGICLFANSCSSDFEQLNKHLNYTLVADSITIINFSKFETRDDFIRPYLIHAQVQTSRMYFEQFIQEYNYTKCNGTVHSDCFFSIGDNYYLNFREMYPWYDFAQNDTVYFNYSKVDSNTNESPCLIKLQYDNTYIYFQIECI